MSEYSIVGRPAIRKDWIPNVTGEAQYSCDMVLPKYNAQ